MTVELFRFLLQTRAHDTERVGWMVTALASNRHMKSEGIVFWYIPF